MASGRKVLIWAILGLFILALLAGGILMLRIFRDQALPLAHAVPEETLVLVRPLNMKDLPGYLEGKQGLLTDLRSIPFANQLSRGLSLIDSLLALQPEFREMILANEMLLALMPNGQEEPDLLILFQVRGLLEERKILMFIREHYPVVRQPGEDVHRRIRRAEGPETFYFSIAKGIFTGSRSLAAVEKSLQRMESETTTFSDADWQGVMQASGKNVDANIYFETGKLVDYFTGEDPPAEFQAAALPGDLASLDLLVKPDGILLNGFFSGKNGNTGFAPIFTDQEVVASACPIILPSGTHEFYKLAFSNFDSLCGSLARLKKTAGIPDESSPVSDFEKRQFSGWTGREVTLAGMGAGRRITAFAIRPEADALQPLQAISTGDKPVIFRDNPIYRLSRENMIRELLWPFSGGVDMPFYCLLEGHVIFGSSVQLLTQAIRHHAMGNVLAGSRAYQSVASHITANSHLSFYREIGGLFPSFTAQFSISDQWLYASMFISRQDSLSGQGSSVWSVHLEDSIMSGPYIAGHGRSEFLVLASDRKNTLYIISAAGKVIARKQLSGPLMDGVSLVEGGGSGNYLLFNTLDRIYLIDPGGADAPGFPVILENPASAGLVLIPSGEITDGFIVVASADGKAHAFGLDGQPWPGWKTPSLEKPYTFPPQFLPIKKGYLVFRTIEGDFMITDRQGKMLNKIHGSGADPGRTGIYPNRTNSKGIFLTSGKNGNLLYLPEQGKTQQTRFGDFSAGHFFLYEDLDGRDGADFIWLDGNELHIFDRFKKQLTVTALPEAAAGKPVAVIIPGGDKAILFPGISGIVYLADSQGYLYFDPEISSMTPVAVCTDDAGMAFGFIGSDGRSLGMYPLP